MIQGGIVGGTYGIDSSGGKNPVVYYYGKDQTKRVGENYTPAGSTNSRPAEFKTTADETYNGGKNDLLTITNGSAESDMDPKNPPNNSVIQLPAGRYHLTFQGYSDDALEKSFRVELRQIQSGRDDIIVTETPGYSTGPSPSRTEYLLSWPDFIVDGTEKLYFLFPASGRDKRSHFLRIEKVA
ncbi:MAG: hypothetical protein OXI63_01815 [Candidatus Poribacteria bacterium]|nr:hypothetical protein [Candidatus Poribacteria bacterium]